MKNYIASMILILGVVGHSAFSQQDESGLIYDNPLKLNPAFAGSAENSRLVVTYFTREQGNYFGGNVSYDRYLSKLKTGIGFQVSQNRNHWDTEVGESTSARLGLVLAKLLLDRNDIKVLVSAKTDYLNMSSEGDWLCVGCRRFTYYYEEPTIELKKVHVIAVTPSILVKGESFAGGIGVRDVNQPDVSQVKGRSELLRRIYFGHFTYQWFWKQKKWGFAPDAFMRSGGGITYLSLGTTMRYKSLRSGFRFIAMNYNEGWNAFFGVQRKRWTVSLAYGVAGSVLTSRSSVNTAVAAQYVFGKKQGGDGKSPAQLIAF